MRDQGGSDVALEAEANELLVGERVELEVQVTGDDLFVEPRVELKKLLDLPFVVPEEFFDWLALVESVHFLQLLFLFLPILFVLFKIGLSLFFHLFLLVNKCYLHLR